MSLSSVGRWSLVVVHWFFAGGATTLLAAAGRLRAGGGAPPLLLLLLERPHIFLAGGDTPPLAAGTPLERDLVRFIMARNNSDGAKGDVWSQERVCTWAWVRVWVCGRVHPK